MLTRKLSVIDIEIDIKGRVCKASYLMADKSCQPTFK